MKLALVCVVLFNVVFLLSSSVDAIRSKSSKFYSIKEPHFHAEGYRHPEPKADSGRPVHSPAFNLKQSLQQIAAMNDDAQKIIDIFTTGELKHVTLERLTNFTDFVGTRLCGSQQLENAVNYLVDALNADTGLENVHAEVVSGPYWTRGEESAVLLTGRQNKYPFTILGLGGSVGTQSYGDSGLIAEAIVVRSFDELAARAAEVPGKFVIYNQYCDWAAEPVGCYGVSVQYRGAGAKTAAQYGAVAALVRTVGGFSIYSPHTGYGGGASIPVASITLEDADMFQRLADRGETLTIQLKMGAQSNGDRISHNVVAEITGSTYPDETVLVSGHLDSWDVGQGAMDDGGGMAISWSVLTALARLGLRPKRTVRLVAWSCEEIGGLGADQYYEAHIDEVPTMSLVMESDAGVFHPLGIQFAGSAAAQQIMTAIGQLLAPINASQVTSGGEGTDIDPWMQAGVPGASLANENEKYFYFHHSNGDTITVLNTDDVDLCAATWAVTAYSVANLDSLLPRS